MCTCNKKIVENVFEIFKNMLFKIWLNEHKSLKKCIWNLKKICFSKYDKTNTSLQKKFTFSESPLVLPEKGTKSSLRSFDMPKATSEFVLFPIKSSRVYNFWHVFSIQFSVQVCTSELSLLRRAMYIHGVHKFVTSVTCTWFHFGIAKGKN